MPKLPSFFLFTNKKSSWLQVHYVLKSNVIKPNNWEKVITLLKLHYLGNLVISLFSKWIIRNL